VAVEIAGAGHSPHEPTAPCCSSLF
jgi:hypothetical protein